MVAATARQRWLTNLELLGVGVLMTFEVGFGARGADGFCGWFVGAWEKPKGLLRLFGFCVI
jgi:hypothetical protein